jgi:hypothetical protein
MVTSLPLVRYMSEKGVGMGFQETLTEGAAKVAKGAEKAFDQVKAKIEELQLERQMDGLARKLGYIEYDGFKGRSVDAAVRQSYLDEMAGLEDQITQLKMAAQAAAAAEPAPEPTPEPATEPGASEPAAEPPSAEAPAEVAEETSPTDGSAS